MSELPAEVNQELEFRSGDCEGRHFLIGNCHTFPGRMNYWCDRRQRTLCVSRSEMTWLSETAAAWVDGFLAGSEPRPPESDDAHEEEQWQRAREHFRSTGEVARDGGEKAAVEPVRYGVVIRTPEGSFSYRVITYRNRDKAIAAAAVEHSALHPNSLIIQAEAEFEGSVAMDSDGVREEVSFEGQFPSIR